MQSIARLRGPRRLIAALGFAVALSTAFTGAALAHDWVEGPKGGDTYIVAGNDNFNCNNNNYNVVGTQDSYDNSQDSDYECRSNSDDTNTTVVIVAPY